jgi:Tol biopolymer transport system component
MLETGSKLGAYEVVSAIGAGGMGEVYSARDTRLNRNVALKVLPEVFAADPDRMARFEREAKLLASLNHPNIAAIYGLEESGSTRALVMELVEGRTLAERIAAGRIPLDEALPIAKQVAEALEYAHDHGVIHRDLKPANIKVTAEGTVKVLDFGLAKALADDPSSESVANSPTLSAMATRQGVILGTAAYMSPEQAKGKTADRRADIWAFGAVLWEMLTGKQLYGGETVVETLASVMKEAPSFGLLPPKTPFTIRNLLGRCLEKDVRRRLHHIGEARIVIEDVLSGAAPVEPASARGLRPLGWRAIALAFGTLFAGVIITGLAFWALMRLGPPEPSRWLITPSVGESLTSQVGTDVAISPDGTRIVYLADRNGTRQLYVRQIDRLEARALSGTEGARAPFFSPDGEWVAFGVYPEAKLKKVSLLGGPAVTICDIPDLRNASWGADGTIVFASGLMGGALFRVPAAGGKPELLASPDTKHGEVSYRWPEILPGERAVVFTIFMALYSVEQAQIAVLSLDTGERKVVVQGGSNPHYASTGHLIYGQVGTLMVVPFDLGSLRITGTPAPVEEGVYTKTGGAADFAVSRNGSLIYIPGGAQGFEANLVWVDRKGQVVGSIAAKPLQFPRYLRLSPDGRRLALTIGTADQGGLWVYDLQGRPPKPLTLEAHNEHPVWTPDGTRVAFLSTRTGLNLFWMPSDGSTMNPEPLLAGPNPKVPFAWTPDGRELIYGEWRPGTRGDILALPLDGERKPREIVATEYDEWFAALSPGGRWLAYVSDVTGRDEIWVRAYPGSAAPVRVSLNGGDEPVWSRDGHELFYLQGNKMMAVSVQTGQEFRFDSPSELFDEPFRHTEQASYDVAPDGRFLMVQPSTGSTLQMGTSIVVVQNWFEELKQKVPTGKK